jgi:FAD-linked oxidoreductase
MSQYTNWARNIVFTPSQIAYPENENQLCELLANATANGKKVRVVGSAHSWTGLIETNQTLVSLDKMQGLVSVDGMNATVWAGTKLKMLGQILFEQGLAMENLGDIDVQAIAGAASTGTHGTGANFQSIANQVSKLRIATASGEIVECSADNNPELFDAARVSLGSLGIITQITLRCIPAYNLTYTADRENLFEVLDKLDEYNTNTRNFEFYYFPHTDWVQTKYINITKEQPQPKPVMRFLNDVMLENAVFGTACKVTQFFPSTAASISKLTTQMIGPAKKTHHSHRIFATVRMVRFNEMEYNIPAEHFKEAIVRAKEMIEKDKINVNFPIECRFVKSDNLHLSPAYQRESAYLAFHVYQKMPYKDYFRKMEDLMLEYDGRPHWGKMHTLKADTLSKKYPKWNEFLAIREKLDPNQTFINQHLKELFGV